MSWCEVILLLLPYSWGNVRGSVTSDARVNLARVLLSWIAFRRRRGVRRGFRVEMLAHRMAVLISIMDQRLIYFGQYFSSVILRRKSNRIVEERDVPDKYAPEYRLQSDYRRM